MPSSARNRAAFARIFSEANDYEGDLELSPEELVALIGILTAEIDDPLDEADSMVELARSARAKLSKRLLALDPEVLESLAGK